MRGRYILINLIIVFIILAAMFQFGAFDACGSGSVQVGDGDRETYNPLVNRTWRLVGLGSADDPEVALTDVDLTFTYIFVSGWTGCNSVDGVYSVQGTSWNSASSEGRKRLAQPRRFSQQERLILGLLQTLERFEVSGQRLTLHSEGGQVLIFNLHGQRAHY